MLQRVGDEFGALDLRFGFEQPVSGGVRDNDRQQRVLDPAADGEMQAVERIESHADNEQVRAHRVEQTLRLVERGHCRHEVSGVRQKLIDPTQQYAVGVDEQNQSRHGDVRSSHRSRYLWQIPVHHARRRRRCGLRICLFLPETARRFVFEHRITDLSRSQDHA